MFMFIYHREQFCYHGNDFELVILKLRGPGQSSCLDANKKPISGKTKKKRKAARQLVVAKYNDWQNLT